jgi:cobalt-zinc-cadmium efflux system outer membrane protein
MNKAWIRLLAAVCTLAPCTALAADTIDEREATRRVCTSGPDQAAARAHRLRGEAEVTAAGVLPNPSLIVQHQQTLSGPAERETVVGLSAPLGIGGRRFLLQDAAAARRLQSLANARATTFQAALAFREAFAIASLDEARVEVMAAQQAALDALTAAMRGLTRGGEAAGYDLLRQETQGRLHLRALQSARGRAVSSRALLRVWTGADVKLASGAGVASVPSTLEASPPKRSTAEVESLEAGARAGALEARAARRRWIPDLEVFAGYRAVAAGGESGHGISLGVTVPLTFFDHGQAEAARAEADQQLAEAGAARMRRGNQAELTAARARIALLQESVRDADQAAADALKLRDKANALYRAGEAMVLEVLEAYRVAEEAQLARLDLAEEMAMARLAAMRASGTLLDASLDRACAGAEGGAR